MDQTAANIKNQMTFQLIIEILEERGIMTERELEERLTNKVILSKTMNEELKQQVIQKIKE